MITKIIMPKLGETMEFGTLVKWRKKEGDKVNKGDILFDVETDKAVFEFESPKAGLLRKIVVPASEEQIPVLTIVGYISDSMDDVIPAEKKEEEKTKPVAKPKEIPAQKIVKPSKKAPARIFISPLARKMAKEKNLDISTIHGTGPGGRIVARDIPLAQPTQTEKLTTTKTPSRARKIMAERMTLSKTTIPHFYLLQKINMTKAMILRSKLKKEYQEKFSIKLTITDLLIKALSKALQKFSNLNGTYENNSLNISNSINIGIAVSFEDELYVPKIKNVQELDLIGIAKQRTCLVENIYSRKIDLDSLSGGTFTLSNLGNMGLEGFVPIINPPEIGILGTGTIKKELTIENEKMMIADMMQTALSCDHRAINGMYGAEFLIYFKELMENPSNLT